MSSFEIVLIVMACCVPVVAILFVLPKLKKKQKKVEKPVKTYEELKKEEVVPVTKIEPKAPKKVVNTQEFSSDDFRSYLAQKRKNTTIPSRVELPDGFVDTTMPYMPRRRRRIETKPKTVAEEIKSLSPELKALIISGVLEPKNFDN